MDAFLAELADPGLALATDGLPALSVEAGARARLLEALDPYQRFARFERAVADLLQVSPAQAAAALRSIDDEAAWQVQAPGVAYLPVAAGPDAGFFLAGFLRVAAGLEFPLHEHLGDEVTLVLQGAFEESQSREVFRPGQPSRMPAGSRHTLRALPGGPDLVGLVAVKTGVRLVAGDVPSNVDP
jgi:anti-sigma factor ChrR (cupin superfamily)